MRPDPPDDAAQLPSDGSPAREELARVQMRQRAHQAEREQLKARLAAALETRGPRTAAPPFALGFLAGLLAGALVMTIVRAMSHVTGSGG